MKFKVEGVEEETTVLPEDKILRLLEQQTIMRRVEFARLCTDLHLGKIQRYDTPHPTLPRTPQSFSLTTRGCAPTCSDIVGNIDPTPSHHEPLSED